MAIVFKTPKSALNTTSKAIQNLGNGECPPCPDCPEVILETADVNYTENGEYTLTPEGDGFSKVDITVNVDTETPYNEGYAAGETAGIATGKAQGIAEQKAKLTSTTITENGTTTREDGWNSVTVNVDVTTPYNNGVAAGEAAQKAKLTSGTFVSNGTYTREDGYNSVTVNVPSDINNQDKTVDPSTSQQTVSADNGYSGLGQVTVNAVTSSIDQNIQANNIKSGVSILGVQGSYDPQPNLETGEFEIETVGTSTFTPDRADGFDSVEIRVIAQPLGCTNNPFDNIQTVLDTDFVDGYFESPIASGEMNERTGYYDAVAGDGTVFHIKPYLENPDYDPENPDPEVPEYIFPEDFDLAGKDIIVYFNKANIISPENQAKAPLLRSAIIYEFNDCDLSAINYNFEPTTWPFGTLDVTENGKVDPTGYAEIDVNVASCPDWSSIGWDCNDVAAAGIDADVAYAAQKKAEYEAGTITTFSNDTKLVFAPIMEYKRTGSLFTNCTSLRYAPYVSLHKLSASSVDGISYQNMFNGCSNLVKANVNFNDEQTYGGVGMFQSCEKLQEVILSGTSKLVGMSSMFNGNMRTMVLSTVSSFDTSMVSTVQNAFRKCSSLTNLGGFTNLGKAFVSTETTSNNHTLDLSASTVLTKQSIMNVINNLAAPDDTAVTDATLKLSAASYALLTEEDIAIATAKRWTVSA